MTSALTRHNRQHQQTDIGIGRCLGAIIKCARVIVVDYSKCNNAHRTKVTVRTTRRCVGTEWNERAELKKLKNSRRHVQQPSKYIHIYYYVATEVQKKKFHTHYSVNAFGSGVPVVRSWFWFAVKRRVVWEGGFSFAPVYHHHHRYHYTSDPIQRLYWKQAGPENNNNNIKTGCCRCCRCIIIN